MEKKSVSSVQDFNEGKFTKRVMFQDGESVVFVLNFLPGQELPKHKHPGSHVYLLVLQGSGTVIVDGKETEVAQQDVVHCEGNEEFSYKNTGSEPSSVYVVLNKVPDESYTKNI